MVVSNALHQRADFGVFLFPIRAVIVSPDAMIAFRWALHVPPFNTNCFMLQQEHTNSNDVII